MTGPSNCIAPTCPDLAREGPFCERHSRAPAVQRGGWLSAFKRKSQSVAIDASNIATRLWVGGAPPVTLDMPSVDMLVLCAREIQPAQLAFHGHVLRCPIIDDVLSDNELRMVLQASGRVAKLLSAKRRVLVTCAQGRNRSALVAALALGRITRYSADQLIDLVRKRRRTDCLTNPYFREVLVKYVGAGRGRGR